MVALIWGCFYKRGEKVLWRNYFVDDEKRNKGSVCLFKMKNEMLINLKKKRLTGTGRWVSG